MLMSVEMRGNSGKDFEDQNAKVDCRKVQALIVESSSPCEIVGEC